MTLNMELPGVQSKHLSKIIWEKKSMDEEMNDVVVIVIDKGMVIEAYSDNANQRIIVVDLDNRRVCEDSVNEFS